MIGYLLDALADLGMRLMFRLDGFDNDGRRTR